MNVQPSRDFLEIAALYATGEIAAYTELVRGAADTATKLAEYRDSALAVGGELVEIADSVYALGTGAVAPPELGAAYAGLTATVLETAAGEFFTLAYYPDPDIGSAAPNCYGSAALYLVGEIRRYELARAVIDDCIQELRALAARATAYGIRACERYPALGSSTLPAECITNSVYDRLAAQITAEIEDCVP